MTSEYLCLHLPIGACWEKLNVRAVHRPERPHWDGVGVSGRLRRGDRHADVLRSRCVRSPVLWVRKDVGEVQQRPFYQYAR